MCVCVWAHLEVHLIVSDEEPSVLWAQEWVKVDDVIVWRGRVRATVNSCLATRGQL